VALVVFVALKLKFAFFVEDILWNVLKEDSTFLIWPKHESKQKQSSLYKCYFASISTFSWIFFSVGINNILAVLVYFLWPYFGNLWLFSVNSIQFKSNSELGGPVWVSWKLISSFEIVANQIWMVFFASHCHFILRVFGVRLELCEWTWQWSLWHTFATENKTKNKMEEKNCFYKCQTTITVFDNKLVYLNTILKSIHQ